MLPFEARDRSPIPPSERLPRSPAPLAFSDWRNHAIQHFNEIGSFAPEAARAAQALRTFDVEINWKIDRSSSVCLWNFVENMQSRIDNKYTHHKVSQVIQHNLNLLQPLIQSFGEIEMNSYPVPIPEETPAVESTTESLTQLVEGIEYGESQSPHLAFVRLFGEETSMGIHVFALLKFLAENKGRIIPRRDIQERLKIPETSYEDKLQRLTKTLRERQKGKTTTIHIIQGEAWYGGGAGLFVRPEEQSVPLAEGVTYLDLQNGQVLMIMRGEELIVTQREFSFLRLLFEKEDQKALKAEIMQQLALDNRDYINLTSYLSKKWKRNPNIGKIIALEGFNLGGMRGGGYRLTISPPEQPEEQPADVD